MHIDFVSSFCYPVQCSGLKIQVGNPIFYGGIDLLRLKSDTIH